MADLRIGEDGMLLVRLSDAYAQCAGKHPLSAFAVDEFEPPLRAVVGLHAAAGDVEPTSVQAQRHSRPKNCVASLAYVAKVPRESEGG